MKFRTMAVTAALLMLAISPAMAAGSSGYNYFTALPQSDVRVTVPFNVKAEGTFTVSTITGNVISVPTAFPAGSQYANAYYVRLLSGNGAGLWSTISISGIDTLTLADANVAARISSGDQFRVYKHHTLGSIFPNRMTGVSHLNGTQLFIYENNIGAMSINKSASQVAAYTTSGGGRWVGAGGVNNNTILKPETQVILRNNSTTQTLKIITLGDAPDHAVSALIAPNGDLVMGTGYPLPLVLKNAGLNGNLRQVYLYDNAASGINKSAIKVASFTTSGGGRWVGAGVTGDELLAPSQSFTFRLPVSEAGTKVTLKKPY